MPEIEVGPVIGAVTHNGARVLVQSDADCTITCVATEAPGIAYRFSGDFKASRPGVFELSCLEPDTTYDIGFEGASCDVEGRVRTLPEHASRLNLAAVSCNFTVRSGDVDLWADLRDRYVDPGNLDLILHVGDQIYGDSAFQAAMGILNGRSKATKREEAKILDLYRKLYYWTWRHRSTREVLARIPNLMIWDDHEIRDDWGSRPADQDPRSPEHYVGTLARRVFREYQRQLWDNFDPTQKPTSGFEDHFHIMGNVGVIFVDQRGGRSFEVDSARPYLGTPQWERLASALSPSGAFASVRALVVVTSVPLVYLSHATTTENARLVDDLMDHWSYKTHAKEQIEFIRLLRRWKEFGNGNRELLVIGGDVHIGGHTEISHKDDVICKQLITSPITNKPPSWLEFYGIKLLLESDERLGGNYTFEHENNTRHRNYGVIVIRVPDSGKPHMVGELEIE